MEKSDGVESQIWDCDPLVIVDSDEKVAFAGRCKMEFSPSDGREEQGRLCVLNVLVEGRQLSMVAEGRLLEDESPLPQLPPFAMRLRAGRTYWGEDEEGSEFTWYVNGDAERYLVSRGWQNV